MRRKIGRSETALRMKRDGTLPEVKCRFASGKVQRGMRVYAYAFFLPTPNRDLVETLCGRACEGIESQATPNQVLT